MRARYAKPWERSASKWQDETDSGILPIIQHTLAARLAPRFETQQRTAYAIAQNMSDKEINAIEDEDARETIRGVRDGRVEYDDWTAFGFNRGGYKNTLVDAVETVAPESIKQARQSDFNLRQGLERGIMEAGADNTWATNIFIGELIGGTLGIGGKIASGDIEGMHDALEAALYFSPMRATRWAKAATFGKWHNYLGTPQYPKMLRNKQGKLTGQLGYMQQRQRDIAGWRDIMKQGASNAASDALRIAPVAVGYGMYEYNAVNKATADEAAAAMAFYGALLEIPMAAAFRGAASVGLDAAFRKRIAREMQFRTETVDATRHGAEQGIARARRRAIEARKNAELQDEFKQSLTANPRPPGLPYNGRPNFTVDDDGNVTVEAQERLDQRMSAEEADDITAEMNAYRQERHDEKAGLPNIDVLPPAPTPHRRQDLFTYDRKTKRYRIDEGSEGGKELTQQVDNLRERIAGRKTNADTIKRDEQEALRLRKENAFAMQMTDKEKADIESEWNNYLIPDGGEKLPLQFERLGKDKWIFSNETDEQLATGLYDNIQRKRERDIGGIRRQEDLDRAAKQKAKEEIDDAEITDDEKAEALKEMEQANLGDPATAAAIPVSMPPEGNVVTPETVNEAKESWEAGSMPEAQKVTREITSPETKRTISQETVNISDIVPDVGKFQHRIGINDKGEAEGKFKADSRFKHTWSDAFILFREYDGTLYLVDGHQRYGIAMRDGGDIQVTAWIYSRDKGWSPSAVRAEAALKNIRKEDTENTPYEAAELYRLAQDDRDTRKIIIDNNELLQSNAINTGRDIANGIMGEAYNLLIRSYQLLPANYAVILARALPNKFEPGSEGFENIVKRQKAIIADMIKFPVRSKEEAEIRVNDMITDGDNITVTQLNLLGEEEVKAGGSIYALRTSLLNNIRKKFLGEKQVGDAIAKRGEKAEDKGLVQGADVKAATEYASLMQNAAHLILAQYKSASVAGDIFREALDKITNNNMKIPAAADYVTKRIVKEVLHDYGGKELDRIIDSAVDEVIPDEPSKPLFSFRADAKETVGMEKVAADFGVEVRRVEEVIDEVGKRVDGAVGAASVDANGKPVMQLTDKAGLATVVEEVWHAVVDNAKLPPLGLVKVRNAGRRWAAGNKEAAANINESAAKSKRAGAADMEAGAQWVAHLAEQEGTAVRREVRKALGDNKLAIEVERIVGIAKQVRDIIASMVKGERIGRKIQDMNADIAAARILRQARRNAKRQADGMGDNLYSIRNEQEQEMFDYAYSDAQEGINVGLFVSLASKTAQKRLAEVGLHVDMTHEQIELSDAQKKMIDEAARNNRPHSLSDEQMSRDFDDRYPDLWGWSDKNIKEFIYRVEEELGGDREKMKNWYWKIRNAYERAEYNLINEKNADLPKYGVQAIERLENYAKKLYIKKMAKKQAEKQGLLLSMSPKGLMKKVPPMPEPERTVSGHYVIRFGGDTLKSKSRTGLLRQWRKLYDGANLQMANRDMRGGKGIIHNKPDKPDILFSIPAPAKALDKNGKYSPTKDPRLEGTKVVDKDGKPLVVYHGTGEQFDDFNPDERGSATAAEDAIEGIFFTDAKESAKGYSSWTEVSLPEKAASTLYSYDKVMRDAKKLLPEKTRSRFVYGLPTLGGTVEINFAKRVGEDGYLLDELQEAREAFDRYAVGDKQKIIKQFDKLERELKSKNVKEGLMQLSQAEPRVINAHLAVKNPLEVNNEHSRYEEDIYLGFINQAKQGGHDGLIIKNTKDTVSMMGKSETVYVAFDEGQIINAETGATMAAQEAGGMSEIPPPPPPPITETPAGFAVKDGGRTVAIGKTREDAIKAWQKYQDEPPKTVEGEDTGDGFEVMGENGELRVYNSKAEAEAAEGVAKSPESIESELLATCISKRIKKPKQ